MTDQPTPTLSGPGLREADLTETMRLVEYDMTNQRHGGVGDRFVGQRKEVATIINALRAALANDTQSLAPGFVLVQRELLADFVEAAADLDEKHRDDSDIWESAAAMSIRAGSLRKLAALAAQPEAVSQPVGGERI